MIVFSYEQAFREAARLDETAQRASALAERIEQASAAVSRSWEGDQARHYREKLEQLRCDTAEDARRCRALAEQVREIAEKLRDMEEMNVQIAGSR